MRLKLKNYNKWYNDKKIRKMSEIIIEDIDMDIDINFNMIYSIFNELFTDEYVFFELENSHKNTNNEDVEKKKINKLKKFFTDNEGTFDYAYNYDFYRLHVIAVINKKTLSKIHFKDIFDSFEYINICSINDKKDISELIKFINKYHLSASSHLFSKNDINIYISYCENDMYLIFNNKVYNDKKILDVISKIIYHS